MDDSRLLDRRSLLSSLAGGLVAQVLPGCAPHAARGAASPTPGAPDAAGPPGSGAATAVAGPGGGAAAAARGAGGPSPFAPDFAWGTATAAYQIEGAAAEDGRGPSVWDVFCRKPGATFEGHTGDVACDHYHRYADDVALLAKLGARAYRFSISWPRVLPEGRGAVNEKGLDFYERLVDALLAAGIEPFATLFHWDYPQALFQKGGWLHRDAPAWFADYTSLVVSRLGDRVRFWMTQNEPSLYVVFGHVLGLHAPGLKLSRQEGLLAGHHSLLAHGRAVQAIRAGMPSGRAAQVGLAFAFGACHPYSNSAEDTAAAAEIAFAVDGTSLMSNAWWMDPVLRGSYPEDGLRAFGAELPRGFEREAAEARQPLDFVGLNIYFSQACRRGPSGRAEVVPLPVGYPRAGSDWQAITPQALYHGPRQVHERYGLPIYITENGLSVRDQLYLDGAVHDAQRIDYLRRAVMRLADAARDGVPVRGYFHWSFLDNFEWADGYKQRFGLVYVDYADQRRTPKDSFGYYAQLIASNGAVALAPTAVDADRVSP